MRLFKHHIALLTVVSLLLTYSGFGQETVFNGLTSDLKRADKYFNNQNYANALVLYLQAEKKRKSDQELSLKIARTYHKLNEPEKASLWYEKHSKHRSLPPKDTYDYAESLTSLEQYQKAIKWYKIYLKSNPENSVIMEKIWRIRNIEHLYSDSSYFEVSGVVLNTEYAESAPAYLNKELVFISNRKIKGGIANIDPLTNLPFHSLYRAELSFDSSQNSYSLGKPKHFLREQNNKLHQGPVAVSGSKLFFTRNSVGKGLERKNTLQLFWAEKIDKSWKGEHPFEYNSDNYSVSHPSLTDDGNYLYFVSDMPGGLGGSDIYRCSWNDGQWSGPQNLGESINTMGNESAPFIHNEQTLYFASDGHAGFGGFDVFKASLGSNQVSEVQNIGYPINTRFDDFGLILNKEGSHGFFASNRANGGFDDDIFEVAVDLQSYPLLISGIVKYNDPNWLDLSRLEVLPKAHLKLIDNLRDAIVYETYTDLQGTFSLNIPYSGKFKIQVTQQKVGQTTVSLEIPKNRKLYTAHEIVVIKENFRSSTDGNLKMSRQSPEMEKSVVGKEENGSFGQRNR